MSALTFCNRCQHVRFSGVCAAAVGHLNIITGKVFTCSQPLEVIRLSDAYCGVVGVWFETRKDEEKQQSGN